MFFPFLVCSSSLPFAGSCRGRWGLGPPGLVALVFLLKITREPGVICRQGGRPPPPAPSYLKTSRVPIVDVCLWIQSSSWISVGGPFFLDLRMVKEPGRVVMEPSRAMIAPAVVSLQCLMVNCLASPSRVETRPGLVLCCASNSCCVGGRSFCNGVLFGVSSCRCPGSLGSLLLLSSS